MRAFALILLTGLVATTQAEDAVPASAPVRAAVEKALPFLEKEGVKWHMDNTCLSCHHIPFMTTGEALYVLNVIGAPTWTAADRQRAVDYLLKSQLEDVSWYQDHKRISSKIRKDAKPRVDTIYSYFATGWATMGLLQLLPERAVADAGK